MTQLSLQPVVCTREERLESELREARRRIARGEERMHALYAVLNSLRDELNQATRAEKCCLCGERKQSSPDEDEPRPRKRRSITSSTLTSTGPSATNRRAPYHGPTLRQRAEEALSPQEPAHV